AMSPLRSTASNRRLIDMASFRFRHRHQESDALVEMLFASEGKIRLQLPLRGKSNCNLPLKGKSRMLFFVKHRDAKRYNYLLSCSKRYLGSGRPIEFLLGWPYTRALTYAARKGNIQVSQPKAKNASTE